MILFKPVQDAQNPRGYLSILDLKCLTQVSLFRSFIWNPKGLLLPLRPGEYLASVDIQGAYLHFPINYLISTSCPSWWQSYASNFWPILCIQIIRKGIWTSSCSLGARGIQLMGYLNDFLLKDSSPFSYLQMPQGLFLCFGPLSNQLFLKSALQPSL